MLFISYLAAIVIHDRNLEGMDHLKPCSRETVSSSSHDHKQCPIKKNDHKQCYASMDDRSNQSPWWGWRFLFPLLLFSISAVKLSAGHGRHWDIQSCGTASCVKGAHSRSTSKKRVPFYQGWYASATQIPMRSQFLCLGHSDVLRLQLRNTPSRLTVLYLLLGSLQAHAQRSFSLLRNQLYLIKKKTS